MEGCGYRDLQADFDALGVSIVGVSFDSPDKNQGWAQEEAFLFELWTDEERELALHYGAVSSAAAASPSRITVMLNPQGYLELEYNSVSVATHPKDVLHDAQVLYGGAR